jgi:2-methylisocitrate lyase-like PEP mutase family enzyme
MCYGAAVLCVEAIKGPASFRSSIRSFHISQYKINITHKGTQPDLATDDLAVVNMALVCVDTDATYIIGDGTQALLAREALWKGGGATKSAQRQSLL